MKRIFFLLILILFLVACGGQADAPETPPSDSRLRVVATIFPQYDFIRQIAGERVALSMLLSPGAESHGFEPTPRDMIVLNEADLLIYVGGHSDVWVEPILVSLDHDSLYRIALVDLVNSIQVPHSDHDDEGNCDHHHGGWRTWFSWLPWVACTSPAYLHDDMDEHVWTSPQNAILIVRELAESLARLDPENAGFFLANAADYIAELEALDAAFAAVVAEGARQTLIFGDRFPFRYLTEAHGLTAHAAFVACGVDTQASPATIAFLIETIETEEIPVVFYIELSNRVIANTIAEATGARLLELHSAHNVSPGDFSAGVTYLDLMWRNVDHLREALR